MFSIVNFTNVIYLLVYVNSIVITGSDEIEIATLISTLHTKFSLNYLGVFSYFLGIEVSHMTNSDLLLTQGKYIRQVKVGMENAKSTTTMSTFYTLFSHIREPFNHPTLYKILLGAYKCFKTTLTWRFIRINRKK